MPGSRHRVEEGAASEVARLAAGVTVVLNWLGLVRKHYRYAVLDLVLKLAAATDDPILCRIQADIPFAPGARQYAQQFFVYFHVHAVFHEGMLAP